MISYREALSPDQTTAYNELAGTLSPYTPLGADFESIDPEVAEKVIRQQEAIPEPRSVILSIDPSLMPSGAATLGDALVELTPRVITYAQRNMDTVPGLIESGHIIGIGRIGVYGYEGLKLSLWKPERYEGTPFRQWIPASFLG